MIEIFIGILKYLRNIVITLLIISIIIFIISKVFAFNISTVFIYASMACMFIGLVFATGGNRIRTDHRFFQMEINAAKSTDQSANDRTIFKSSNLILLLFMIVLGILLRVIADSLISFGL